MHAKMSLRFALILCLVSLWLPATVHSAAVSSPYHIAPPAGIAIAAADRKSLEESVANLGAEITRLRSLLKGDAKLEPLLADVEVFHKAAHWALAYDEFFRSNEVSIARTLLKHGTERARQLATGQAPWLTATGLVVHGFVSRIDGSVQPYGLVVPASFAAQPKEPRRLDVWLHGRDNHLTELKFISDRQRSYGDFAPADTFVVHPYGRYCNAFKFAGETDVFEALEHAAKQYPINRSRLAIRGFSMGGAGCWHLATHHAGFWAGAAPGAGFAETAEYTRALTKEPKPAWFERKLWHLYDATDYAANLFNCPTIAYSGELDKQKQAADMMAHAMKTEGLELTHLIGPGVEHKYEPKTKQELARRFDELLQSGSEPWPERVRLTTWSLRYNRNKWVTVDAMEKHWERASVDAQITSQGLKIKTTNVAELTLAVAPKVARPHDNTRTLNAEIDGLSIKISRPETEPWTATFAKHGSQWALSTAVKKTTLQKHHGLQGPIDDALMDSFLVVRPTGQPMNETLGRWTQTELARFTNEWRAQFRGDARVKNDSDVSLEDLATHHLILFGDPMSNRLLTRIARQLPVRWDAKHVQLGKTAFPSDQCVPVFIYPNPLNPAHYVVVNSGFTFWREGSASNAQQTPKLPDFALMDMTTDATGRMEERILFAGFFGERWEVLKP